MGAFSNPGEAFFFTGFVFKIQQFGFEPDGLSGRPGSRMQLQATAGSSPACLRVVEISLSLADCRPLLVAFVPEESLLLADPLPAVPRAPRPGPLVEPRSLPHTAVT